MASPEDLESELQKSLESIKSQDALIRRSLLAPQPRLLLAVKHAATMLGELRTSTLPPKLYYELYNSCFDSLTGLQVFLLEDHQNHHLADVYEIVEYTGNVLPRLYLMITVGTVFLQTGDAPNLEVLKDMLEMCKGVQHPLKGLFLRYYLSQRTGELSSQSKAEDEFHIQFLLTNFIEMNKLWVRYQHQGHSRDFKKRVEERKQLQTVVGSSILRLSQLEAVDIKTFTSEIMPEMLNQVVQCRDKLAQEYVLDIIVQAFPVEFHLESLEMFLQCLSDVVPETSLPPILTASLDRIRAFMSLKHEEIEVRARAERATLDDEHDLSNKEDELDEELEKEIEKEFKDGKKEIQKELDEKIAMAEHVTINAVESEDAPTQGDEISESDNSKVHEPIEDTHEKVDGDADKGSIKNGVDHGINEDIHTSVSESEGQVTPESDTVDNKSPIPTPLSLEDQVEAEFTQLFGETVRIYWSCIESLNINSNDRALIISEFLKLLKLCNPGLDFIQIVAAVAGSELSACPGLENFVISVLDFNSIADALDIFQQFPTLLDSQSQETQLQVATRVIDSVLNDTSCMANIEQTTKAFELFSVLIKSSESNSSKLTDLARLIPTLVGPTPEHTLELLKLAEKSLSEGGVDVIKNTYAVLIYSTLNMLHSSKRVEVHTIEKTFQFLYKLCQKLCVDGESPLLAFRLFIVCSSGANALGVEEASYELFAQSMTVYEEAITETPEQVTALSVAINNLTQFTVFTTENYVTLAQTIVKHAQHLLKKPDQCILLTRAAHLFWDNQYADGQRVLDLLQKAQRASQSVMNSDVSASLALTLLDSYIYFFQNEVITINAKDIKAIYDKIADLELSTDYKCWLERINKFVRDEVAAFPRFQDLLVE